MSCYSLYLQIDGVNWVKTLVRYMVSELGIATILTTDICSRQLLKWIPSCRWVVPWSSSPAACRGKTPPPREGTRRASLSAEAASPAGRVSAGGEAFPAAARKSQTRGSEYTRLNWRKKGRLAHKSWSTQIYSWKKNKSTHVQVHQWYFIIQWWLCLNCC